MKYAYPAIFTFDKEDKIYYVRFPDIENCFTDGKTLAEALEMGEDALTLMLCQMEDDKAQIPVPSNCSAIKSKSNETVSLVFADTTEYRRQNDSKAVKKTLTIPNWLNIMAERKGVNFSAVLQKALKEELGV